MFISITLGLQPVVRANHLQHKGKDNALRQHRQKSDGNMNKLKIFFIFVMCKRRFLEH